MMNRQRLICIGCIGLLMFLAISSLLSVGDSAIVNRNHPQPVSAPTPILLPAKATPAPGLIQAQSEVKLIPQRMPTPSGVIAADNQPATQFPSLELLPGWLFIGMAVLFLGVIIHFGWQRNRNDRSAYRPTLAKGVQS